MGTSVVNDAIDPRLKANTELGVNIRKGSIKRRRNELFEQDTPVHCPVVPDSRPALGRCLIWHINGCCYDNCRRKGDHIDLNSEVKEEISTPPVPCFREAVAGRCHSDACLV